MRRRAGADEGFVTVKWSSMAFVALLPLTACTGRGPVAVAAPTTIRPVSVTTTTARKPLKTRRIKRTVTTWYSETVVCVSGRQVVTERSSLSPTPRTTVKAGKCSPTSFSIGEIP